MNTQVKHTPGPWTLERDRAKSLSLYSGSVFIGEVYHEVDEPSTQEQANAHLIAAAPAMYAALQKISDLYRKAYESDGEFFLDESEIGSLADAALAQAVGRG